MRKRPVSGRRALAPVVPLMGLVCLMGLATACGSTGTPPDGGSPGPTTGPATTATTGAPSRTPAPPPSPTAPPVPATYSDFDGDRVSDLVLTDPVATVDGVYSAGYAAVVPGSPDGLDTARHQVITQNSLNLGKAGQGGAFGGTVRSADLDGDGRADLITGAGTDTVFVVWGGEKGLAGGARLAGSAPVTGDFDGDGYADLVTAGRSPSTATLSYGPFSRAGVPAATVPLDLTPKDRGPDPDSGLGPDAAPGSGPDSEGYYTARLAAAGDVNGDGRDDLVVTWTHVFVDEMPVPRATAVHHGTARGAGGVSATYTRLKDAQGRNVYGADTLTADVDKDGAADVIVGRSCEVIGEEQLADGGSRLTVVYGGRAGRDRAPNPTTIDDRTPGLPGAPVSTGCYFGAAATAGDVNGDGYADVAFTAPAKDGSAMILVLRGGGKGLTGTGAQHLAGLPGTPRLALLDTDGDGAAELAIGAARGDFSGDPEVRVLRGGPDGLADTDTGTGTGSGTGGAGADGRPRRIGPADLGLEPVAGDKFGWDFGH